MYFYLGHWSLLGLQSDGEYEGPTSWQAAKFADIQTFSDDSDALQVSSSE